MKPVTSSGYLFNEKLLNLFNHAFHDAGTIPTSVLFPAKEDEESIRNWEVFNGKLSIPLRWALSYQNMYVEDSSPEHRHSNFIEVEVNTLFKTYHINHELSIHLIFVRINEDDVLIYAKDFTTNHMAYALLNLVEGKIIANVGEDMLEETLGADIAPLFFNYLTKKW